MLFYYYLLIKCVKENNVNKSANKLAKFNLTLMNTGSDLLKLETKKKLKKCWLLMSQKNLLVEGNKKINKKMLLKNNKNQNKPNKSLKDKKY